MLTRTTQAVRAVAEQVGILTPTVPDASKSADEHRQNLVAAQSALDEAEATLQNLHDAGADEKRILAAEAALASKKIEVSRAEARYLGAEKRLTVARDAETRTATAAAIIKRDAALAVYSDAVDELDRLAAEVAKTIHAIDAQYSAFSEARAAGVASVYVPTAGRTLANFALDRAVAAQAGLWTDDKPTAADLGKRVAGALLAEV